MEFLFRQNDDNDDVTPLDLLDLENYTTKEVRQNRLTVCNNCEEFIHITKTCKQCGCFMKLKSWLAQAQCPLEKWEQ